MDSEPSVEIHERLQEVVIDDPDGPHGNAVRCFGAVEAVVGGTSVKLSPQQKLTLGMLAAAGSRGLTADELLDEMYRTRPDSGTMAPIMLVSRLRKKLPGLITGGGRYAIDPVNCSVDIWQFARELEQRPTDALRLWGTPFLGLDELPSRLVTERERLIRLRLRALPEAGWQVDVGSSEDILVDVRDEAIADPCNEALTASAAAATYRLGRQVEALELVQECCKALVKKGLNPSPMLRDVECAILNHQDEVLASRLHPGVQPAETIDPTLPPALTITAPNLVGRGLLCDALTHALEMIANPDGSSEACEPIIVRGAAGSGKTASVARVIGQSIEAGSPVRVRVGLGEVDGPPYGPILGALPELQVTLDEITSAGDPTAERRVIDQNAAETIRRLAKNSPLMIVIDDVHDSDGQTLALAQSLVSGALPANVLFVLTCRTDRESSGAWTDVLEYLIEGDCRIIDLDPLTVADTEELVRLDHPESPPMVRAQFARRIHELSEGNGHVTSVLSRDAPKDLNTILLPEAINAEESLAAHLRRKIADPLLEDLLTSAALIGRQFDQELLAFVANLTVAETEAALRTCGDVCRSIGDGVWQFDHLLSVNYFTSRLPLLRPVIFARIAQHHGAPVESMPRYVAGAGTNLPVEFAYRALLQSGNMRLTAFAFHDAFVTFTQALELAGEAGGDGLELRLWLAACASRCGAIEEAREHRGAAFALALLADDHDAMAEAALAGLPSGEFAGGEPDRLEMLQQIDPDRVTSLSRETLARHRLRQARLSGSSISTRDLLAEVDAMLLNGDGDEEPLEEPARSSPEWIALEAERLVAICLSRDPEPIAGKLNELAEMLELGPLRAEIRQREVVTALIELEPTATTTLYQRAASEVHAYGSPRTRWSMDLLEAALSLTGTRESVIDVNHARRSGLRLGIPDVHDSWHVQLFTTAWIHGLYKEALTQLDLGRDQIADNMAWHAAEAFCAAKADDLARARREVNYLCERLPGTLEGPWSSTVAALLAETAYVLSDEDAAEIAIEVLAPQAGRAIVLGAGAAYLGPADRYLGVATAVSSPQRATSFFESAIAASHGEHEDTWTERARTSLAGLANG